MWYMKVRIAQDTRWGGQDFKAGDAGRIFWQYPFTANVFTLAQEAPVMRLFGLNEQCLGVPWTALQPI